MRSSHSLDRLDAAFDDDRLVADAGLLLPATLAHHLGPEGARRASTSTSAPGRPGERRRQAPDAGHVGPRRAATASTTRTRCGRAARAGSWASPSRRPRPWARSCAASAGATSASSTGSAASSSGGPGRPVPVPARRPSRSISTRRSARRTASRRRAAATSRLHRRARLSPAPRGRRRDGRRPHGPAARRQREHGPGAGHFLRETIGRVRAAGATGELTVRADSGFYAHAVVAVCRTMDVRFSITIRQHRRCAG